MAIYHFSVKTISRSQGRSAVACAAYRSGEKLTCDYYGKEQDYTKKSGVEHTQIYAPENTQKELLDRQTLWNTVEKSERRKDALLAREFEIAFPQELNKEQRQAMLNELCQDLVKCHGVIVDAAIHAPHTDGGSDERNYHAHIMFTTRAIDPENGEFSAKKYRDFSRDNGTETVGNWREHFATLTNDHLAKAGYDVRVDHRSYKDQENGLEATIHEGYEVTQLRRNGIETEISLKNDSIKNRNAEREKALELMKGLEQEIFTTESLTSKLEAEKQQRLEAEQLEHDVSRFYEAQNKYSDFMHVMSGRFHEKEAKLEEIKKNRQQVEKIVNKFGGPYAISEYDAMKKKFGELPDFWISEGSANSEIRLIEEKYNKNLQALAKEENLLKTVTDLTLLHKSLVSKGIELDIPRQKKIFGIAISSRIPPSAETVEGDLEFYLFKPLGEDFKDKYKEAIKSTAQKKKDAEERLQRERKTMWAAAEQERLDSIAREKATWEVRRSFEKEYGYRPGCEYDLVRPPINQMASLMVSYSMDKRDLSEFVTKKVALLEQELKEDRSRDHEKNVFGQVLEMLEADKKLLKDDSKNHKKISDIYEKITKKLSEKEAHDQYRLERERKELAKPALEQEKRIGVEKDSSNDPSP